MFGFRFFQSLLKARGGFTLVEMIVSVTAFAVIIVMAFDVMGNIWMTRLRVSDKLDINKDLYFSVEKITALIKEGGSIDYEEYWNRRALGTSTMSGHYANFSGYGNYGPDGVFALQAYGSGFYYCRSSNGSAMWTDGCLFGYNTTNASVSGKPQRFGQYAFQFIDYNINRNADLGDEDGDGSVKNDDDDESLGEGPEAFSGGVATKELYLIKTGDSNERTYFRWNVIQDPEAPLGATCDFATATGTGCLGNIQILKLSGRDYGLWHTGTTSPGRFDGIVDTWECHVDYNCAGNYNLPLGKDDEWINIFPEYINVKNVNFYLYPSKDYKYAWKDNTESLTVNPYVRLDMTIGFNWGRRKKVGSTNPELTIATTINLTK